MQHIVSGYRGMSLLFDLNWDRIMYIGTIALGLLAGGFVGSFLGSF
ncbi:hypothetical protein SAMN05444398_101218 [Roseovarius pacificus]|uniref:Uncharacterized protein n=1 Tax=Roseovarius pacificus TaxID=337701 RepID=A0A1M6WZX9_9RHOB|nr:hypothetical protein [Roseovarius pacificus]GGO52740.1 hypothetical protein GCM10011315_09010 [Roseovarius pacificus]SHK99135.1 hypothetical protein SAMN05444398_101218 [Roseovarius pacificus]